jgi:hypothetical protein
MLSEQQVLPHPSWQAASGYNQFLTVRWQEADKVARLHPFFDY